VRIVPTNWKAGECEPLVLRCRIHGCNNLCIGGDVCERCLEEIAALSQMAAEKETLRFAPHAARRLENYAYMAAVIGMMTWILFEFRGFIADCFELWFRGKQW
jgi:hypothetical protein